MRLLKAPEDDNGRLKKIVTDLSKDRVSYPLKFGH